MDLIKILLADDHILVRAGIKSLLKNLKDIEVVGEVGNGREALSFIRENQPDIVLLDISMSELNGLEVAERITVEFPKIKTVILSMHTHEEYVLQALKAGASGYILKDAAPTELEMAIEAVRRGEIYLSPAISKHLVDDYLRRIKAGSQTDQVKISPFEHLTSRQREVLQLIAEGNPTKDIANKLNISVKTVETHRMQIMERIGVKDIAGLVRYAIRMRIISPED